MRYKILVASLILLPLTTLASTYGSDELYGHSCTADTEDGGTRLCSNTVDGNTNTMWSTTAGQPNWIRFDLGTPITNHEFMKFRIMPLADPDSALKDFTITANNTDIWSASTTLYIGQGADVSTDKTYQDFYFSTSSPNEPASYRYWRINFLSDWRDADTKTYIWEIQAMKCLTDCYTPEITTTTQFGTTTAREAFNYKMSFLLDGLIIALVGYGIYKFTYGRLTTI